MRNEAIRSGAKFAPARARENKKSHKILSLPLKAAGLFCFVHPLFVFFSHFKTARKSNARFAATFP